MGKIQLQHFVIVFDRGDAVFRAGEYVSGKCVIRLDGELNLNRLAIRFKGMSDVRWTETTGSGDDERTDTYTSQHRIVDLSYFPGSVNSSTITRGEHHFPFTFQLPLNGILNSFEGIHGNIRYWVEAEIEKPEIFKFNHRTQLPFQVIDPVLNTVPIEELLKPLTGVIKKHVSVFSGTKFVELSANISRTGFCSGETIIVNCTVNNQSKKTVVPRVTLKQMVTYRANGGQTNNSRVNITRAIGTEIGAKQINSGSLLLPIPSNIPLIGYECPNISLTYAVIITAVIPGSSDIHLNFPITITNQPFPIESK